MIGTTTQRILNIHHERVMYSVSIIKTISSVVVGGVLCWHSLTICSSSNTKVHWKLRRNQIKELNCQKFLCMYSNHLKHTCVVKGTTLGAVGASNMLYSQTLTD